MNARILPAFVCFVFFTTIQPCEACIWDSDTLRMEKELFPEALELITGNFVRHSKEFYQWRVKDREKILETISNPELYDDLAVGYEKLGEHQKAIDLILKKQELYPNLYTTEANLGTFYIHQGKLEQGLEHIEKAIAINPNAHFGREIYQKLLVKYVLSKQKEPRDDTPLRTSSRDESEVAGFAKYVFESQEVGESEDETERAFADMLDGVLGMMMFGNHASPILLEALGDILLSRGHPDDVKRLAVRAYLKASYHVKSEESANSYRKLAEDALAMQTVSEKSSDPLTLTSLEKKLQQEIAKGDRFFEQIRNDELKWIREGKNLSTEFNRKYYDHPKLQSLEPITRENAALFLKVVTGLAILAACGLYWITRKQGNEVSQT